MGKITITNAYGDKIVLDDGTNGFKLLRTGDLGGVEVVNTTEKGYLQRGTTVTQKNLGSKLLAFTFATIQTSHATFKEEMRKVTKFFEPEYAGGADLSKFTIEYENTNYESKPKQIRAYLRKGPTMGDEPDNHTPFFQRMLVTFLAPQPGWKDILNSTLSLTTFINGLIYPIDITDSFVFGEITEGGVDIIYDGNISTSVIIEFQGPATNPEIINSTTGQSLKLLTTLTSAQSVRIDTDYENPEVKIIEAGVETNGFEFIDPNNSDLDTRIVRGTNTFEFNTDDTVPATATLTYKKVFLSPYGGY